MCHQFTRSMLSVGLFFRNSLIFRLLAHHLFPIAFFTRLRANLSFIFLLSFSTISHFFRLFCLQFGKYPLILQRYRGRNPEPQCIGYLFRTYKKDLGNLIWNVRLNGRGSPKKASSLHLNKAMLTFWRDAFL